MSEKQKSELVDLKYKLVTPKGLTEKQQEKLDLLIEKRDAEPQLSRGAKTQVKQIWLEYEKGFKSEIVSNKYLNKGLEAEEDAITLISDVDHIFYTKNTERITKGNLTGECDVKHVLQTEEGELKIIHDTKCSWNPSTFMAAELSTQYEWQGRAYMYLYDADIFRLRYCLVDCPPAVYAEEYKKFCFANNIVDDALPQYQEQIAQFKRNFIYSDSELYTKKERVKTFDIVRDKEKEAILLKSIELALVYYQEITLNM